MARKIIDRSTNPKLFGLLAKFDNPEDLIEATRKAYDQGYRRIDAYAPYPVEGLSEALHLKPSPLPLVIAAGAVMGGISGFLMQYYGQVIDYPLNIGGKPLFSWPAWIPITFELVILVGALAGVAGLFFFTRFPEPYHPVFNVADFVEHGSTDSFYLGIEAADHQYRKEDTHRFLEGLGALQVTEVEA